MTLSRRYLLFYLFVSSTLTYGSSRRIPRGASCPSCSQDCPEALTVKLPRDSQELNLRDFSITSYQNSPYFRLTQERMSQDEVHDNILLNHNSMFHGNRKFPQQQSNQNRFNNSPKFLDRQETFSQNEPASKYPLVVPSRRIFDRSENLFFRNPRNKNSEFLSEDDKMMKDNKRIQEISTRVKSLWKNSRDTSATQPERSFFKVENIHQPPQEDAIDKERSAIKKFSSSANQFKYSQERYNPVEFDSSEVERIPYKSYNKDTELSESTEELFDDWDVAKESSQSSNLDRLRNNPLEVHPAKETEITVKNDNKKINSNYNYNIPQNSHIWKLRENEKFFDSSIRTNPRLFKNKDDKDVKEYFEDETEQNSVEVVRDNPHILSQNTWKDTENEELLDNLDFIDENSQETEELELYSERNNKYSQEKDVIFQDEAYTSAEITHAPTITAHNAYIIPRYLNIVNVNDKNYPIKSEMQELSEIENSVRAISEEGMNQRFFEDETVVENRGHVQDLIFPKNTFEKEYSNSAADKQNDTRTKNETVTKTDLDISDNMEDLSLETTENSPV
ncbi:hypothetical protein PUN28_007538 [Cardiocondyla obscurior]